MQKSSIRKPLSVLLSILMVLSVFGGMAFNASAEGSTEKTIAEGVIYKQGDTIVLPGNGNYYVKDSERHPAQIIDSNGTITQFEGDGYSYAVKINGWDIYTYLNTFDYWEEMEQGLSVLGITFTGSGTQSDPYLLKLALGEVESTWAGEGEGTEASPWLIKDLNDLRTLSANVASGMTYSGKYLKLAADIDCGSDNWEPIGGDKPFAGTFDGDGKTITYSIICSEDDIPKGLFAKIGSAGTVKNLNVAGSIVNTAEYAGPAGGIAADNFGLIENCYSAVDITKGCDRGTGGIAAFNEEGATIRYCAASGTLTWTGASDFYACIGGITSEVYESTVTNSTSLCNVLAENAQDSSNYAGIFIGRNVNNYATPECYYLSTAATAGFVNKDSAEPKTPDELKAIGQAAYDAGYTVYGLALGAVASAPSVPAGWYRTDLADLEDGDTVIIAETNSVGDTYAMKNNNGTSSAPGAAIMTVTESGTLDGGEVDLYDCAWVFNTTEGGFTFTNYNDTNTTLFCNNTNNGVRVGDNSNNVFSIKDDYLYNNGTSRYLGVYNNSNWRCYTSTSTNIGGQTLSFWKYVSGSGSGGSESDPAVENVIALIDAIGTVALTDECKQKIDAAKAAYDALTDAQKALVSNYETLQLAEGQYAALQLAADMTAFEAYKTAKKSAMDALLQEGDSEAVQSIVGLAKTQIEGFTYDESKTLDENKAALDTLVANVPNAVAEQRAADKLAADKAAFAAYKTTKKADLDALLQEGDSDEVKGIVGLAKTQVDGATYDESKTLDENKTALDDLVANVPTAIATQRATDLYAAKIEFDHYKAEQKAAVEAMAQEGDSEAVAQIIADAAAAIDALIYDEFYTLAENKATVDTLANIADRLAAQRAADAAAAQLAADKAAFDAYKFNLVAAVQAMAQDGDSEAAAQIIADAAAAIALLDYDTAKTLDENKAAVDALANIADALAAQRAADKLAADKAAAKAELDAYKSADDYRTAEKEDLANAIADAKAAIDGAADTAAVATALAAAKADIDAIPTGAELTAKENQDAANAVIALIDAIGDVDATQESIDKVVAADEAFEALNDAQKALVTNAQTLTRAKNVLSFEMTKVATKAIIEGMRSDDDSAEMKQVMDDAIAAVDALQYDDAKTDEENSKTIEDCLYNAIHAVIAQLTAEELAAAKAQLAAAVEEAEAYYDSIKDAYPEIAADLYTNYSMAARAMNSDDAEEVLDAVGNVNFAVEEAKKAVAEADAQTGEPTNNDGACPLCGKNHSKNFVIDVIHHMIWFAKQAIKNLAGLVKAFKK